MWWHGRGWVVVVAVRDHPCTDLFGTELVPSGGHTRWDDGVEKPNPSGKEGERELDGEGNR